jgi:hypothetical protein
MTIKFGKTILNLENDRLHAWVNRYLSRDEMRVADQCTDFHQNSRENLPYPNFRFRETIRFNELYVPSGASRFTILHAVGTRQTVEDIMDELGKGYEPLTLEFSAGGNASEVEDYAAVKFDGYLLPPHPLSFSAKELREDPGDRPTAWMLPIVDRRYFWQWRHLGLIEDESFDTLQDAVDYAATQLGIKITVRFASHTGDDLSAFPAPKTDGLNYANAAIFLDAITSPLGMLLTPNIKSPTGYDLWGFAAAQAAYRARMNEGKVYAETTGDQAAGGEYDERLEIITGGDFYGRPKSNVGLWSLDAYASARPEKVTVLFLDGSAVEYDTDLIDTLEGSFVTVPGSNRVVRVPVESDEAGYSQDVAEAFVQRFRNQYDWTIAGIRPWLLTSFDDCVIYSEQFVPPGGYCCFTRAMSHAHNFAAELSESGGGPCDFIKFTITAVNETCTQATVTIDHVPCGCSTVPEDDNGSVTVHDVDCQFDGHSAAGLIGLQGDAKYMTPYGQNACKWVVTALCCDDDTCADA